MCLRVNTAEVSYTSASKSFDLDFVYRQDTPGDEPMSPEGRSLPSVSL